MRHELAAALQQAERSEASVRAAALLRIARVLTATDQAEAERLLDRGLALLAELPEAERSAIAPQAACLAACVAPARAFAIHATAGDPLDRMRSDKLFMDMARSGHAAAAIAALAHWTGEGEFPYMVASSILNDARDDDERREVLRSGLRAWHRDLISPNEGLPRRSAEGARAWHAVQSLLSMLEHQWRLLPADEARAEIRTIVRVIQEGPDGRVGGSFGGPRGKVKFSSYRPMLLFQALGPLRRLDPELADAMIREHRELARAAAVYPDGYDIKIDQPSEPPSP